MSLSLDKKIIRNNLLRQREQLSPVAVRRQSATAQAKLLELAAFQRANTLALYSPIRNEVSTDSLLVVALAAGKRVCYPCVEGADLHFFQINSSTELQVGCFGVCEPDRKSVELKPDQIELLLMPGVAFDRRGFRLGYGRGYFDRLLDGDDFAGLKVGLCYDFQVLPELPVEVHDQRVELLVTDKEVFSPS